MKKYAKQKLSLVMVLVFMCMFNVTYAVSAADMSSGAWTKSGEGTTTITKNDDGSLSFAYDLNSNIIFNGQQWIFDSVANSTETFKYNWSYSYFHSWFQAQAKVTAYADGPDGEQSIQLYANGGTDSLTGSSSLKLHQGYHYGFRIYGKNGDSAHKANGTLTISHIAADSVSNLSDISVAKGTAKSEIGLPDTVDVGLNNNTTTSAAVVWNDGNPNYDGDTLGTYTFTGTITLSDGLINPNNLEASVNVIVTPAKVDSISSLSDINVKKGTSRSDIGLPDAVDVGLSDNTTTSAAVVWNDGNPAYDGDTLGNYTFTGTITLSDGVINPNNLEASVNVIVKDSDEGNEPTIPSEAKIVGETKVGRTLTAQLIDEVGNEVTTGAAVTYEWYRLDNSDSNFSEKVGTDKTYKLTGQDLNKYIGLIAKYGDYSFDCVSGKIVASSNSSSSSSHHSKPNKDTESTNTDKTTNDTSVKKTGWAQDTNGKWYLVKENGNKETGWKAVNNNWYFFNTNSGEMVTGWYKSQKGDWTYNGQDVEGQWFHLDTDGKLTTGWLKDADNNWYYLSNGQYGSLGSMLKGWQKVNEKWYYFNSNGAMESNSVIDGYTLGTDGAWIE